MILLYQFFVICVYLLFIGFCFCDGFKLHVARKLIWFFTFAVIAIHTLKTTGMFYLERILPLPTLLAFLLCWYEIKIVKNNLKK